ncbi:UDP-4-amino-4,6-dideoxy-N-acetyl-beta-L-altrosamine transaminase [Pokkaliibacter sp. CJK22405]|uniref:UDP-4-amino-4, 6-dideoxy-N-acetyl-beta-L-altrosamine transaminase n=1 Tax=Pokkaliibacter sp. CJK22405 TaxID=3384615 RepID=UPI00398466F6
MIPYGRHQLTEEDINAVVDVLRHQHLTQGAQVPAFEAALAGYTGATHVCAVNSATSALHLVCLALGMGPGDVLWTSPLSFVASSNCALYCGAGVDFVDIDPATLSISLPLLEEKLAQAHARQQLPKALITVHFAGLPTDMQLLHTLCQRYGIALIEDASHAVGADCHSAKVGECRWSDAAIFSFHPVKMITTAEGGAVLTPHEWLDARVRKLRTHGIVKDAARVASGELPPWYYEQEALGFNYRLTDMQAALGLSQLTRLDSILAERRRLAARYRQLLADLPLTLAPVSAIEGTESSWHLYVIQLNDADRRLGLYQACQAAGIGVQIHYIPIYWQPYYQQLGFSQGYCPQVEEYYRRCLTLPLYVGLTDAEQDKVVAVIRAFFEHT